MKHHKVGSVMTPEVVRVGYGTPFKEVVRLLADNWISGLPVVDEDEKVIGVVSETDLMLRQADTPDPWLDLLRSESPVHHDPATGLWLVSRHQDIRRVLLDPERFLPDNAQHAVTPMRVPVLRVLARAGFTLPPALANNGTPSHPGLREWSRGSSTRSVSRPPCR